MRSTYQGGKASLAPKPLITAPTVSAVGVVASLWHPGFLQLGAYMSSALVLGGGLEIIAFIICVADAVTACVAADWGVSVPVAPSAPIFEGFCEGAVDSQSARGRTCDTFIAI